MTTGVLMACVALWMSGTLTVMACVVAEMHEQREMKA